MSDDKWWANDRYIVYDEPQTSEPIIQLPDYVMNEESKERLSEFKKLRNKIEEKCEEMEEEFWGEDVNLEFSDFEINLENEVIKMKYRQIGTKLISNLFFTRTVTLAAFFRDERFDFYQPS